MTEQEKFEYWVKTVLYSDCEDIENSHLKKVNDDYPDAEIQTAWRAWQAGKSTKITLPKKFNLNIAGNKATKKYFYGRNEAIDDCKKYIEQQGFNVKE